ncbi:EF-hand calcium-binding domain-containing protein 10 isoform X2 [Vidua macroura]|uniref:EF-hand calcium-binding domain-containing protein 10 isoform X2 n=1 Tax=Vidua chalybeata TaxID=81927 RepID=UPI0023A8EA42|nr:EF-hand calcium-binding domain-containing protein 10 isoform X2 [Vidua chalybeata]XP_053833095.1 EF-hand calcium-binding domain-containing protein 10 isoform X2 [Vidua macroura]
MAAGEEQSREYLRRHRLPELLHRLGALLLFHRPERPREFLIQVLERVKAGRRAEGEYPFLMDEANVDAMFGLLDVLGQGYIRPAQYREALKTLGLSTEDLELEDDVEITLDVFKKGMKKKMLESWSVY